MKEDDKFLDLLAIFHYVVAGLTALFACFPLIHVAVGVSVVSNAFERPHAPPAAIGWNFVAVGGTLVACGWALAVAILIAGRKLKKRVSWTYCIVMGAIECMLMPFGTILGVFTLIVNPLPSSLSRHIMK